MAKRLNWDLEGQDWPNRDASRFVSAGGVDWQVQVMGTGPVCLLVHGTGASTHSWRGLAPLLAEHFTVIAPDLPGHGFSHVSTTSGLSLHGIAASMGELLKDLDSRPVLVVGHSAGAAILAQMSLDGIIEPTAIVSLNGALLPFEGVAGQIFSPIAKLLALNPFVPRFFAWRAAERTVVERLLKDTGSRLDPDGIELYARLARNPGHVAAALAMMARWDLHELRRSLPWLKPPLHLIVGGDDGMIPPQSAFQVKSLVPNASVVYLRRLGHLAHEQQPAMIAETILDIAVKAGIVAGDEE